MENDYFDRLVKEIRSDGRSLRSISMSANLGENFISQMIKSGTQPSTHNLMSILEVLGGDSAPYVLLNIRISPEHLDVLERFQKLRPEAQENFHGLLRNLEVPEGGTEPRPSNSPEVEQI